MGNIKNYFFANKKARNPKGIELSSHIDCWPAKSVKLKHYSFCCLQTYLADVYVWDEDGMITLSAKCPAHTCHNEQ